MATTLRIKRRSTGGSAGAPASLKTAELAYNMADGIVYVGYGDDGSGNATSVKALAKHDYVDPSGVYQPIDGDLTAFAALDATAGLIAKTAADTYARRSIAGTSGRVTVTNGSGASGNPTVDLDTVSPGSSTGGGYTKFTTDAYGRVDNRSQAILNDIGTATSDYSLGGFKITSLGTPSASTDAATKGYVDNAITGLDPKASVVAATTANLDVTYNNGAGTLTANSNGAIGSSQFDGVTPTVGQRLLVKDQSTGTQNGIYTLTDAGSGGTPYVLTRATDADAWDELRSAYVFVEQGTAHADQGWLCTVDAGGTLGSTSITFVQFSGTGAGGGFTVAGDGLGSSGSTVSVNTGAGITITTDAVALAGQALALHNVATAADKLIYATGSATFTTTDLTSVARTLLAQTTQSAMRSTGLGLGTIATQDANNVNITGGTIDGVTLDGGTF